jgi:hypothetical protein
MKKCALAFFILLTSISVFADQPPKNRISEAAARKIALDTFDGKVKSGELEYEHKRWVYSFDISDLKSHEIHEIGVDAITGKIVENKIETPAQEADELKSEKSNKK